jgi:MFS transporter, SP family, arabinose:H+ symporter
VTAVPVALFFIALFTISRNPRWLVKKGRAAEARTVLQLTGDENFEHDLRDIVESIEVERRLAAEKLLSRRYGFPIFQSSAKALAGLPREAQERG